MKGRVRTGSDGVATVVDELCGVVAVVPLAVARIDLLPVGTDEGLLPAHPAVGEDAFDVHRGWRGALVGRVLPLTGLVQGLVAVADLCALEGDASWREAWLGVGRGTVCRGWLIGVCR